MPKDLTAAGQWIPATCSAADLAVLFGVSQRTITNLVQIGALVRAEQPGWFQTIPSIQGYLDHLRKKAQGRATDSGLTEARAKQAQIEGEIASIKLAQLKGEVLTLDEVSDAWSTFAVSVRSAVLTLPTKARATIPHLTAHDGEVLRILCREVLESAAEEVSVGVVGAVAEKLTDGE